jgi:hypothetical protein
LGGTVVTCLSTISCAIKNLSNILFLIRRRRHRLFSSCWRPSFKANRPSVTRRTY